MAQFVASGPQPGRGYGRSAARWLVLIGALGPGAASAAAPAEPAGCGAAGADRVVVEGVNPDFSLRLADGRAVRLAGIEPVAGTTGHPALAADLAERVNGWLAGRTATLQAGTEPPDRWGRVAGLVTIDPAPDGPDAAPLSAAWALVDAGLARGRPEPLAQACWPALRAAEAGARAAGLGLWADPDYAVLQAADGAALAAMAGSMVLVEGRVAHVGRTRTHIYVDLGPGRMALSLRVDTRRSFILDQAGLSDKGGVGRLVRARGDLNDSMRPSIDIEDAGQIEVLDGPGAAAGP